MRQHGGCHGGFGFAVIGVARKGVKTRLRPDISNIIPNNNKVILDPSAIFVWLPDHFPSWSLCIIHQVSNQVALLVHYNTVPLSPLLSLQQQLIQCTWLVLNTIAVSIPSLQKAVSSKSNTPLKLSSWVLPPLVCKPTRAASCALRSAWRLPCWTHRRWKRLPRLMYTLERPWVDW